MLALLIPLLYSDFANLQWLAVLHFFRSYCWRQGYPCGLNRLAPNADLAGITYKIAADPYRRHVHLEQYRNGTFSHTLYDSRLLDFRSLMTELAPSLERHYSFADHTAIVRDICDRVVWLEKFQYTAERCHICQVYAPHGLLLSTHRLFYTDRGDIHSGVIFYDAADNAVFYKRYELDPLTEAFSSLLEENWEISPALTWRSLANKPEVCEGKLGMRGHNAIIN